MFNTPLNMFTKICSVEADTSKVFKQCLQSPQGGDAYYCQRYEVCLLFGLTELKAFLVWVENVGVVLLLATCYIDQNFVKIGHRKKVILSPFSGVSCILKRRFSVLGARQKLYISPKLYFGIVGIAEG